MLSISQAISHFPDLRPQLQNPSLTVNTSQTQAHARSLTNTNFSFVTAEGDRVSLARNSEVATSYGTYTYQGLAEGQAVSLQTQQFSAAIRDDLHFFVEGDLNEQEQADIQAFLNTAQDILEHLVAGNADEAAKTTASLQNLGSLAQAALFVRQETTVSFATQTTGLSLPADRDTQESPVPFTETETDPLRHVVQQLHAAQEAFHIDPEKLATRLPNLITTLTDILAEPPTPSNEPQSPLERFQEELVQALLRTTDKLTTERLNEQSSLADEAPSVASETLSPNDQNRSPSELATKTSV